MSNTKPLTEAQKAAQRRYDSTKRTRIFINLVNSTDADILAYMKTVPNKQGLIKMLIRRYMDEQGVGSHIRDEGSV